MSVAVLTQDLRQECGKTSVVRVDLERLAEQSDGVFWLPVLERKVARQAQTLKGIRVLGQEFTGQLPDFVIKPLGVTRILQVADEAKLPKFLFGVVVAGEQIYRSRQGDVGLVRILLP